MGLPILCAPMESPPLGKSVKNRQPRGGRRVSCASLDVCELKSSTASRRPPRKGWRPTQKCKTVIHSSLLEPVPRTNRRASCCAGSICLQVLRAVSAFCGCEMAAFAVVVGALHEHLAHVALRHSARKEQRAQSQGKVLCRTAALPSWSFVACELVRLLQQFPSGVSEAVIYTHVVERWSAQVRQHWRLCLPAPSVKATHGKLQQ